MDPDTEHNVFCVEAAKLAKDFPDILRWVLLRTFPTVCPWFYENRISGSLWNTSARILHRGPRFAPPNRHPSELKCAIIAIYWRARSSTCKRTRITFAFTGSGPNSWGDSSKSTTLIANGWFFVRITRADDDCKRIRVFRLLCQCLSTFIYASESQRHELNRLWSNNPDVASEIRYLRREIAGELCLSDSFLPDRS